MTSDEMKRFNDLSQLRDLLPESYQPEPQSPKKKGRDGKGKTVRVRLETAGRKGKTVTVVLDLQHSPQTLEEIARILKQHCGAGGTVKEGIVEIQGDQRERVSEKLREMNYHIR